MSVSLWTYRQVTRVLSPLVGPYLRRRARAGKEESARLNERFGRPKVARPNGKLIWLHGASVGELSLMRPLIDDLIKDAQILVTTGTLTSAELAAKRLPARAIHQFCPVDTPASVRRFLEHWRPDLAVWAESEIWPNLVTQTQGQKIPMALINARMSVRSLRGWTKRPVLARRIFGAFDIILPADRRTAQGLSSLLGRDIAVAGNLKYAAPPLPCDSQDLKTLQTALGDRPIWVAASTHVGEDAHILRAHQDLQVRHPHAALIWVPRHPERADEIARLCTPFKTVRRSAGEFPDAETQIYLFDTLGEMGLALRLGAITLMGGSLCRELTGHNPLEPARLGTQILTGPYIESFSEIYEQFFAQGAALRLSPEHIRDGRIGEMISAQFFDGIARAAMIRNATDLTAKQTGVLDETVAKLRALL